MKFTSSITAFAAVMGFALASLPVSLQAQTTASTTAPATAPAAAPEKAKKEKKEKAKTTEYTGNLTAIDSAANTITVANTTKLLTLSIAPTTKFKKDKVMATLADFAIGDSVSGSYTVDAAGKMTAYSLHKKTMKAEAKTKVKPAKTAATSAVNSVTPAAAPVPAMAPGQ